MMLNVLFYVIVAGNLCIEISYKNDDGKCCKLTAHARVLCVCRSVFRVLGVVRNEKKGVKARTLVRDENKKKKNNTSLSRFL